MGGYLERTLEFTSGDVSNHGNILPLLFPQAWTVGVVALGAAQSEGQQYILRADYAPITPDDYDDLRPVEAGRIVLGLLGRIQRFTELRTTLCKPTTNRLTRTRTLRYSNELGIDAASNAAQILGPARREQTVREIEVIVDQSRDYAGITNDATAVELGAILEGENGPMRFFTTISTPELANPQVAAPVNIQQLTVTAGNVYGNGRVHPDGPPTFEHAERWARALAQLT